MKVTIFTIFPEMFAGPIGASLLKRAQDKGLLAFSMVNFRDYAQSKHKNVDDEPFGGGAGMLLKPEPIFQAFESTLGQKEAYPGTVILMSPQGVPLSQDIARDLSGEEELAIICGHYEGFDERIRSLADMELSIGDYILTGGELPAMVVIDAVSRLIPGVLGEEASHQEDSFSDGLLEHPHYTRPREYKGMAVPDVLLSGNHEEIRLWRRKESLRRTWLRRRTLLDQARLDDEDIRLLAEVRMEEDESDGGSVRG
ncbi:MAG: tRNA (guanosine(37)-N1)-methyltransferase TrmD [Clostridiales bacterium]|nr:tRNA (guanosine(37)-N1)-methyltransferase TrmD [Clostridiales bacterium]